MSVAAETIRRDSDSQRKLQHPGDGRADLPKSLTDTDDTPWGDYAATVGSTHELYPRVPASLRSQDLPPSFDRDVASR
jgi:hypothetical protein